jgi:hypothetical protein
MSEVTRAALVILGMFLPFAISLLVEHDHGTGAQTKTGDATLVL